MKNIIKKFGFSIIFAFMSLFAIQPAYAQVPDAINFQAIARDGFGNVMIETDIMIQLSILDGGPTGTQVYREIRSLTTNAYGSFSFQIGRAPFIAEGEFSEISWAEGDKYLKVDYDPTASLNFDLTLGVIEFVSVPYAFTSRDVVYIDASGAIQGDILVYNASTGKFEPTQPSASNIDWENIQNKPNFAIVATSGNYFDLMNKPNSISDLLLDADSQNIINIATPISDQDAATKGYVDALIEDLQDQVEQLQYQCDCQTFIDNRDGSEYSVILIGNQCWMQENLKYLPSVAPPTNNSLTAPYYYVYDYNGSDVNEAKISSYYETYGVIYNWSAAMNGASSSDMNPSGVQGICPAGWHMPSDAEWTELSDFLGGANVSGGKLKESGVSHWSVPNTDATNETGFTALPGGERLSDNNFWLVSDAGYWWSSTEFFSSDNSYYRILTYDSGEFYTNSSIKSDGYYVRCIKD